MKKPTPEAMEPRRPRRAISHYHSPEIERDAKRSPSDQAVFNEFGRRLQNRMTEKGWNQSDLARFVEARLPPSTPGQKQGKSFGRDRVSHYVRGISLPRPDALKLIAEALECDQYDLLPEGANPANPRGLPFDVKQISPTRMMVHINQVFDNDIGQKIVALAMKGNSRGR